MYYKDCEAYIDESGAKGLLRNLNASRDQEIALLAAIMIPKHDRERFYDPFIEPFERFKAATPPGAGGLHITDAFKTGNEAWSAVAKEVRVEIFAQIKKLEIPVIYDARRLGIARKSFKEQQKLKERAREQRNSPIKILNRPSDIRVEESCMVGISLNTTTLSSHGERDKRA